MKLRKNTDWQTKARGTNEQEYQIYLECANDGNGYDITTGPKGNRKKLKTFDEWMAS